MSAVDQAKRRLIRTGLIGPVFFHAQRLSVAGLRFRASAATAVVTVAESAKS